MTDYLKLETNMKKGDTVYVVCEQTDSNGFFKIEEDEFISEDYGYCQCKDDHGLYMEKCSRVFETRLAALQYIEGRLASAHNLWAVKLFKALDRGWYDDIKEDD